MTKAQNNQRITIILAIVLIATLLVSILAVFQSFEKKEIVDAEVIGANGTVQDGYVSPYQSKSGAIAIYNEATLAQFLTTAGTATNEVYGYLTASFETARTVNMNRAEYHFLDGAGHTITLTNSSGTISSAGQGYLLGGYSGNTDITKSSTMDISAGKTYMPNFVPGYSGVQTPFGYPDDDGNRNVNLMGYLAGGLRNSTVMNLNVQFNGKYTFRETWGEGIAWGVLFGYVVGCNFDNLKLVINGKIWQYFTTSRKNAFVEQNVEGACTVSAGGFFGVMDTSTITNSHIEITANGYISATAKGQKAGALEQGYPRSFVGGVTGCLTNSSNIYNIRCAGEGSVFAWGETPTQDSGKNRMSLSGMVCGSNLNASAQAYTPGHISGSGASACAGGIIDGIISSWTGIAVYYIGESKYAGSELYLGIAYNDQLKLDSGEYTEATVPYNAHNHYFAGCLVGGSSGASTSNVYYTYDKSFTDDILQDKFTKIRNDWAGSVQTFEQRAAEAGDKTAIRFSPIGYTESPVSPNFVNLQIQDQNGEMKNVSGEYSTTYHKFINPINGVVELQWDGLSRKSKIEIAVDLTKLSFYKPGMFAWNFHLVDTLGTNQISEINRDNYLTYNNMQDAINNCTTFDVSNFMTRYTTGLNLDVEVTYGSACTYTLNGTGLNPKLGEKTYDGLAGLGSNLPTIELNTINMSGNTVALERPTYNTTIYRSGSKTIYKNANIWTVYKEGTLVPLAIDNIKDATTYEIQVYNQQEYSAEAKFDFMDPTNRIVAYKADNQYYDANNSEWRPYFEYIINQKQIIAEWEPISNNQDSQTYTVPQSFTYYGGNANFIYSYRSGLLQGELGESVMTYEKVKYVKATPGLTGTVYYSKGSDGSYTELGEWNNEWDRTQTYYRKDLIKVDNICNVGHYKVSISEFSNKNYTIDPSMQKEYEIVVSPRQISIQYRGLGNVIYNSLEQKPTYVTTNYMGNTIYVQSSAGVNNTNANIWVRNVVEPTAVTIVETPGNDYQSVGVYTIEIALATGDVAENYSLPNIDMLTSYDGEDLEAASEIITDEFSKVIKVVRKVTINKAVVKVVGEYENGTYLNDKGTKYAEYSSIPDAQTKRVSVAGEEKEVYYEKETFKGYNNVPAIMMGVHLGNGIHMQVFGSFTYYPAEEQSGVYVVNLDKASSSVTKVGTYLVKIEFNTIAYTNYVPIEEYMLYEVEGLTATVTMNASSIPTELPYTATDLTEQFVGFASVQGLTEGDIGIRNMGIKYWFYVENAEYNAEDKIVIGEGADAKTYMPIDRPQIAGNYLVLVGDNISRDNYNVVYDATCTPQVAPNSYPYHAFVINPIEISLIVESTSKTYATEFDPNNIVYNYTGSNTIIAGDEVSIVFTSAGFAANADVIEGGYAIAATCEGPSAVNYRFEVNEDAKLTIQKLQLRYNVGNLSKTYGDVYDTSTISVNPTGNQILEGDDVTPSYQSEGFAATAKVNEYAITATPSGAKAGNYEIVVNGKIKVNKRLLRVTAINALTDLEYDGTLKTPTVEYEGLQNEDVIVPTIRYNQRDGVEPIAAGTYRAIVVAIDRTDDYNFVMNANVACDFEIIKRTINVNIHNFSMGYGDVELNPTTTGFDYVEGSKQIVSGDELTFTFTTIDPETMNSPKGTYTDVVTMTAGGDKAANYEFVIVSNGDLEIVSKEVASFELRQISTKYTGENLINEIALKTSSMEGITITVKNAAEEEVSEVVAVGEYTVIVSVEGNENYVAGQQELTFTVEKGEIGSDFLSTEDLKIHYNKVEVAGKTANKRVLVSKDGQNWTEANVVTGFTGNQTVERIFVKLAEDECYKESAVNELIFRLTYDPNKINEDLQKLNVENFKFADINAYKKVIAEKALVSEHDLQLINANLEASVTQKYNDLLAASKEAIESTQKVAGTFGRQGFKVATTAASGLGVLVVGLSILFSKKRKNQEEVK